MGRLQRFVEIATRVSASKRVRLAAQLLVAVGVAFALARIRATWRTDVNPINWEWLVAAAALALAAVLGAALIWVAILWRLGASPRLHVVAVFLRAQLGKYVPGAVWQYAGRGALALSRGVPLPLTAKSSAIELAASLCAAGVFTMLLVGWWGLCGVAGVACLSAFVAARLLPRDGLTAAGAIAIVLNLVNWLLIGMSFWMTGHALGSAGAGDLPFYVGSFAAAWAVGLLAFFAPGGLGVREAVLVALLRGRVGSSEALVIAAASRGLFTIADLAGAALSLLTSLPSRQRRVEGRERRPSCDHG